MSWFSPLIAPFKGLFIGREMKSDPTYPIAAQFFTPGQPIWTSRDYRSFVSQGYRRCGTVYTCVNKIAGAAAGIRWKLYTDQSMSREIPSHSLLDLWRSPNNRMGTASFIELLFGYWHLAGNTYTYANRPNPNEPPVELWCLRPDLIKIVAGQSDINGYVYGWGTPRARDFDTEEIMHVKFPSYDDDYYGLSPIEVAMQLVDQQNEGNAWNTALMQNAGKPASVFMSKGYLTVEQRTQVRQEVLKRYSGKRNAGFPLILEADMTWQSMSMSPYELDWLQSRELNTREIAAIFDVAPELVGDSAGKTFANQKEAKQSLYTENVLPKLDRVASHLNAWLVPMYPDLAKSGAWFWYDKSDIEVLAELYTAAQQAIAEQANNMWNNGVCSLRYVQMLQGMPPRKNVYLDVYKLGPNILVREEDLEAYAVACLEKAGTMPASVVPAQLPAPNKPSTTITEEPDNEQNDETSLQGNNSKRRYPTTPERKILDLATKEEKDAYVQRLEADRQKHEATVTKQLENYFDGERKSVVAAIQGCSTDQEIDEAVETALSGQQDKLLQIIYNTWIDVSVDIGGQVASELAGQKGLIADFIKLFGDSQIKYLLTLCGNKIKQITTTTQAKIRLELTEGVSKGESIPELAKRIDGLYLQQIIPNRSVVISRTEVVGSSNWSAVQAAQQSGLTLNKTWLATDDSRTRPAHVEADGQTVPLDQKFIVDGEELDQPGDTSGSAENIIQCRCTVFFQRVKDNTNAANDDNGDDGEDAEKIRDTPCRVKRMNPLRQFVEAYA